MGPSVRRGGCARAAEAVDFPSKTELLTFQDADQPLFGCCGGLLQPADRPEGLRGSTAAPQSADELLDAGAQRLVIPFVVLPSGAGHAASVFANAGIPSGMVFVRNRNGSHNPHEAMEIVDFLKGVDILHAAVTAGN